MNQLINTTTVHETLCPHEAAYLLSFGFYPIAHGLVSGPDRRPVHTLGTSSKDLTRVNKLKEQARLCSIRERSKGVRLHRLGLRIAARLRVAIHQLCACLPRSLNLGEQPLSRREKWNQ